VLFASSEIVLIAVVLLRTPVTAPMSTIGYFQDYPKKS
jgi:hypothetical protein